MPAACAIVSKACKFVGKKAVEPVGVTVTLGLLAGALGLCAPIVIECVIDPLEPIVKAPDGAVAPSVPANV